MTTTLPPHNLRPPAGLGGAVAVGREELSRRAAAPANQVEVEDHEDDDAT